MNEQYVQIEVDGKPLSAKPGQMLIEVTDANGLYIPRFCYHKKLSVAANCRMCLVEVENSAKPLPACATPVADGMKVETQSLLAKEAQQSVMEFLLINHPLDCPICDQGGECELQDMAMSYGAGVSRYQEGKRVVKDKNIGPLIQTDMTRCIHCTRCVRFGEEIGGLAEMGVTGRSEHMEIGTYIEKGLCSELSGNMIDLCPVGALTSKPFRYLARAWEMTQHNTIAAHDSVGSNVQVHVKDDRVMRVVPNENEAINEVWIADRDRFSYEGLYSSERLQQPMIKCDGVWQDVQWDAAFEFASAGLREVVETAGARQLGGLGSAASTSEELYLLQKLLRALGCNNVDHRLRQRDFSQQEADPVFPFVGDELANLETLDAVLLVGSYVRKEQPMINHRLRKSVLRGGSVMLVHAVNYDFNYAISERVIEAPRQWLLVLLGIIKALLKMTNSIADPALKPLLAKVKVVDSYEAIAKRLYEAEDGTVLLGNAAVAHEQFAMLKMLAATVAKLAEVKFGFLSEAANSSGACLAGALPHRGAGAKVVAHPGLHATAMQQQFLRAYLLLGIEPELDCWDGRLALQAMNAAKFVVSVTAYQTELMLQYADVLLPMTLFAENEGSYVNLEGRCQTFGSAVAPMAETKPAWKILRVLADHLGVDGCAYDGCEEISRELGELADGVEPNSVGSWVADGFVLPGVADDGSVQRVTELPMCSIDAMSRRAQALQQVDDNDVVAQINVALARRLQLEDAEHVVVTQQGAALTVPLAINDEVADECVLLRTVGGKTVAGAWYGAVQLSSG